MTNRGQAALGLDVGSKRLGVAVANLEVRFAGPLTTLTNPATFIPDIIKLLAAEDATIIVIGLPRGLSGQETDQTANVRRFGADLQAALQTADRADVALYWMDEALTSEKAVSELLVRGTFKKTDVDALAATYILEDFLTEHGGTNG